MNSNGVLSKHWFHVSFHFGIDLILFYLSLAAGIFLRFGEEGADAHWTFLPFLIFGAVVFSSIIYIFGLYSTHSSNKGAFMRSLVLAFCTLIGICVVIAITYLDYARPPGRGIMLLGGGLAYFSALLHHAFILYTLRSTPAERILYIVTCKFDEAETHLFNNLGSSQLKLVGIVEHGGYKATGNIPVLGKSDQLQDIVRRDKISRVLSTDRALKEPALCKQFCQLRYLGITVMSLISLHEEFDQYVPLELVTSDWLLTASGEPHLLYIKKIKRALDIFCSLTGLILMLPVLLAAMLAVKLTSRGPLFYRQTRSGRFGRSFVIIKLRTMRTDAEKHGVVWSSGKHDPRVTLVGRFLRKYRIDEIPQLIHVLAGQMSFVGPRPERPEMNSVLTQDIQYYQERFMVQPGLTGWAQVNYPYGASVQDARRKLEYDLYYMKHMSLFLDLFILLDTVRIVLCGGVSNEHERNVARHVAIHEWELANQKEPQELPAADIELNSI